MIEILAFSVIVALGIIIAIYSSSTVSQLILIIQVIAFLIIQRYLSKYIKKKEASREYSERRIKFIKFSRIVLLVLMVVSILISLFKCSYYVGKFIMQIF